MLSRIKIKVLHKARHVRCTVYQRKGPLYRKHVVWDDRHSGKWTTGMPSARHEKAENKSHQTCEWR